MTYLLAIDPGKSTGIVLGEYGDEQPWTRIGYWQVAGGIGGFLEWCFNHWSNTGIFWLNDETSMEVIGVCERFIPLSGGGFAQTSDSVEPVRIEGALIALGLMPADYSDKRWQRPASMYTQGGSNKAERLRASRAFLKSHDLLLTGKNVGQKDADDAISATLHSLAYMRKIKHAPTLGHYWKEN